MAGWGYAFRLSKDEVAASEPPGTVKLVGESHCWAALLYQC
jgi:hypothetical protein